MHAKRTRDAAGPRQVSWPVYRVNWRRDVRVRARNLPYSYPRACAVVCRKYTKCVLPAAGADHGLTAACWEVHCRARNVGARVCFVPRV